MAEQIFSTRKPCIKCREKKGFTDINYSDFDVIKKGDYKFPQRIKAPAIPGGTNNYLCVKCVNTFKVECRVHGVIKDDEFHLDRPPRCYKCEEQLKIINKGILPNGFWGLVPTDQIVKRSGDTIKSGYIAFSDDGEIHVVSKNVLFSGRHISQDLKISLIEKIPCVSFNPKNDSEIQSCYVNLGNIDNLKKGYGYWLNLWEPELKEKLKLNKSSQLIVLSSLELRKITDNKFDQIIKKSSVSILAFEDRELKVYPDLHLPSLENMTHWYLASDKKTLKLAINHEGVPHYTITISELFNSCGFKSIRDLSKELSELLKTSEQDLFSLDLKGIFEANLFPEGKKQKFLFELDSKSKTIIATSIPKGEQITFDLCFNYKQKVLLISSDQKQFLTCTFDYKDIVKIKSNLSIPSDLFKSESYRFGAFLDKKISGKVRMLQVYQDGFIIDDREPIEFSKLKKIEITSLSNEINELHIEYTDEHSSSNSIRLIGPVSYSYSALKELEVNKAKSVASNSSLPELYKQYNYVKKQNLLIGLFSDIILLNQELDIEISMDKLVEELEKISIEEFYNNKKLFQQTTKKLLLFSLFLPKIKQNFEYLSSLYPYYQVKNEADIISDAFGPGVATKYIPYERKKIRLTSRKNIRNVQSSMQRIFSEIEKAVYPIEQLFAKEEIQKDLFSKITKYFPQAGQATLIDILVATGAATGGIGILAGILGIRALGDVLNSSQTNRESAARVKKASKTAFSWWRVLKDNLPVAIYEAGEEIDDENTRCMQRDKRIFDRFPSHKKQFEDDLKKSLKKRIHKGTDGIFTDIVAGSGIKFRTLATDIETAIEIDMPKKVGNVSETLHLPQDDDTSEDKNG